MKDEQNRAREAGRSARGAHVSGAGRGTLRFLAYPRLSNCGIRPCPVSQDAEQYEVCSFYFVVLWHGVLIWVCLQVGLDAEARYVGAEAGDGERESWYIFVLLLLFENSARAGLGMRYVLILSGCSWWFR